MFAGIDAIGIAAHELGYTTTACVEQDDLMACGNALVWQAAYTRLAELEGVHAGV